MPKNPELTERINVRCSPEDKALLLKKSAALGLTLSSFLLWEALGEELGQRILDRSRSHAPTPSSKREV